MGGIEQKLEKVESLMKNEKFQDAFAIILDLLKQEEKNISSKMYDKFFEILKSISEKEKSNNIKFNIFLDSFKYLKDQDKEYIREKIVQIFQNKKSKVIESKIKLIEDLKDIDLEFDIKKLFDNKLIEENPIDYSTEYEKLDESIDKCKILYSKLHIDSFKRSIKDKIIECYINKGKYIIERLITLKIIDDIKKELNALNQIINDLKKINSVEESINFISSLYTTGKSYLSMLQGQELMSTQRYEEAYEQFVSIKGKKDRELFQIENQEISCIKVMGKSYEDEENYDKALECYKKNKKFESDKIRVEIISYLKEAKILNENKKYSDAIDSFVKMYVIKKELSNTQIVEKIFTESMNLFLSTLSSYCKQIWDEKNDSLLEEYEKKIKTIHDEIDDETVQRNLSEILSFIKDIKIIGREKILKIKIMNKNNINSSLSEMLQRIYMEILLSLLYSTNDKNEVKKILNIIVKYAEESLYISKEDLIKLRNLFSLDNNKDNKKLLVIISKLYYILSKNGIEFEKNILIIIGNTIISTNKEKNKPGLYTEEEFNEIMIYLFLSLEKLMKEQDYKLNNVEKIYNLVLDPKIKDKKLLDTLLRGYFYFNEKNLVFSNKTINNLLTILLEKEENKELFNMILSAFKNKKEHYEENVPKFFELIFKYSQKEENIINVINSINLSEKILNNIQFKKAIDKYLNKDTYYDSIFLIIKKILPSNQTSKMMEKIAIYEEKKKNEENSIIRPIDELNPEINKRNMRLKEYNILIDTNICFNKEQLEDIENNLNLNGFYELLIKLLENQNNLIDKLNLDIISTFFNKNHYKLFQIICDEKKNWKEKHLLKIIKGFCRNNEEEKKLIIKFLEKVNCYQKLPKIIEKNYLFEKNFINYENLENIENIKLIELLDNFKEIKYFSYKYYKILNKLILSFIHDSNNENVIRNIYKKIIELLKSTSFNISSEIFQICINNMTLDDFAKNYSEILSNTSVKSFLKKVVFDKIYDILKSNDDGIKFDVIKEMKYFIDWELIPSDILNILYDNLIIDFTNKYDEISKEIIYIFGIICSNCKENKIPKDFFEKIKNQKLYNLIKSKCPSLTDNYIIYIYALISYYEENLFEEKDYYKYPRKIILDKIKEKIIKDNEKFRFEDNFKYFEEIHKFKIFSPKRDKFMRKLFINKKNDINKINQKISSKCNEESRIENSEGEKINGKLFGFGKLYYTNGDYYVGYFLNNIKEGEGEFYENDNPNGIKQVWREGKLTN